ncbi:MAG: hypothetical protein QOG62_2375 [Thermoleophilaceae bacterium]|jgi:hypothetical protein|nr:hypothetical protein [Thermoleophilaceae bacterium]
MAHPGALRNFQRVVERLADRGHEVELVYERHKNQTDTAMMEEITRSRDDVSSRLAPQIPGGVAKPRSRLRNSVDYLRYLEPPFESSQALRNRAAAYAPRPFALFADVVLARSSRLSRHVHERLMRRERSLSPLPEITEYLRERRPDVLMITPLVALGSDQPEWLRAAHALGIPTVFCVHSWDNLTNKGLIHGQPDLVTVWNEAQLAEAVEMHDVSPDQVEVVGAHAFDHWFGRKPSRSRAVFCAEAGLDRDRPIVLYVCSSSQISPQEEHFIERWARHIRENGGPLARDASLLVRPHPVNRLSLGPEPAAGVVVWPPAGISPHDAGTRDDYFDSLYHAAAVVGINTSAQIEGAIAGRPVLAPIAEEFHDGQMATVHFRHLLPENGGPLIVGGSLDEHVAQIETALEQGQDEGGRAFVRRFVRPFGPDVAGSPRLVGAIESLVHQGNRDLAIADRRRRDERKGLRATSRTQPAHRDDPVPGLIESVDRILEQPGPILLGPWRGEVGFELLYWIPFLRWAMARHPGAAKRTIALSRGGVRSWYQGIAADYLDLFELHPEEPRVAGEDGLLTRAKWIRPTAFDRALISRVEAQIGAELAVLHPSSWFATYRTLGKRGQFGRLEEFATYEPLGPLNDPRGIRGLLPDQYLASRFYFGTAFPDEPSNHDLAREVQQLLAERETVALLNTGLVLDDHTEHRPPADSRIVDLSARIPRDDNLNSQSVILAGARGYVGSYGGLSYLPPLLGIPTAALYSSTVAFETHHIETARRAFAVKGCGSFHTIPAGDDAIASLLSWLES